jgi:hypothetical protein
MSLVTGQPGRGAGEGLPPTLGVRAPLSPLGEGMGVRVYAPPMP